MATTRSSARDGKPPHGFATIKDILDGRIRPGSRINLIGIITDFRAPIHTRGMDWKCAMRIYDQSVENEPDESVLLNVFRPQNEMPDAQCGDVVIAFSVRVQHYQASCSLVTHHTTDIHIYESSKIPKIGADASKARRPSQSKISRQPSKVENEFVSVLHSAINKERIPTQPEFEVMKINSTNIKNKFSELKDIRDGIFIDTTVQIVRDPYDLGDKFTLWVSDYTEHPSFYKYNLLGGMSYPKGEATSEWTGPLGKRSMQITCFEPHASVIRDQRLSAGTWISLKNLQIKFGHSEVNLEGYLREDRGAYGVKINISQVNHLDSDTASPELKGALRRKRKYEEQKKAELIDLAEAADAGRKRKANIGLDSNPPAKATKNSKQKRNASRAHKQEAYQRKIGQLDDVQPPKIELADHGGPEDLNTQIKCENNSKPATSVEQMLAPAYHEISAEGEGLRLQLPFINANYRTYVRVTDFLPSRLEQFAKPKKISEYAALSDHEQSESELGSDSENESLSSRGSNDENRQWEWRFHLRLEDACSQEGPKKSIWVTVDNPAAEMLLSLDASDLRRDDENLANLRKKMWILWGDLEEHKAMMENRALKTRHSNNATAPPAHSDDEAEPRGKPAQVSNRSFGCCIRQYGATVAESDETKADAGDGKRWQRMFGLFGTQISRV